MASTRCKNQYSYVSSDIMHFYLWNKLDSRPSLKEFKIAILETSSAMKLYAIEIESVHVVNDLSRF